MPTRRTGSGRLLDDRGEPRVGRCAGRPRRGVRRDVLDLQHAGTRPVARRRHGRAADVDPDPRPLPVCTSARCCSVVPVASPVTNAVPHAMHRSRCSGRSSTPANCPTSSDASWPDQRHSSSLTWSSVPSVVDQHEGGRATARTRARSCCSRRSRSSSARLACQQLGEAWRRTGRGRGGRRPSRSRCRRSSRTRGCRPVTPPDHDRELEQRAQPVVEEERHVAGEVLGSVVDVADGDDLAARGCMSMPAGFRSNGTSW